MIHRKKVLITLALKILYIYIVLHFAILSKIIFSFNRKLIVSGPRGLPPDPVELICFVCDVLCRFPCKIKCSIYLVYGDYVMRWFSANHDVN